MTRRRALAALATVLVLAGGVVAASSASTATPSRSGPQGPGAANRLRAIEATRLKALVDADTATVRPLTAPDFQLINPAGAPLKRDDYMAAIKAGAIDYRVFAPRSPIAVRLSGDFAALCYQVSFDLVFGGDTRVKHNGWITEVYERRHGHWQIVWEQATAIPNRPDLFLESIKPVS